MKALAFLKRHWFGLLVSCLWLFPITYFGYWTDPVGTSVFSAIRFPVLLLVLPLIVAGGISSVDWRVLLFLSSALISSLLGADVVFSVIKYAGLFSVVAVVSPLIQSERGRALRESLWSTFLLSLTFVTLMSILWRVLDLPGPVLYTKQGYAGITTHAMVFGPIAGIATVYFLVRGLSESRPFYFLVAPVCALAAIASSSRAAILSTAAASLAVLLFSLKRGRLVFFMKLLYISLIILIIGLAFTQDTEFITSMLQLDDLIEKGFNNSREGLWEMRMQEYRENPFLGVGVGMSYVHERVDVSGIGQFTGTVEPGSAYLVVLSMTGAFGAATLILAMGVQLYGAWKYRDFIPHRRKVELAGIGVLLSVHGIAEGWIFSPGIVFCLFFWLWLGIIGDSVFMARTEFTALRDFGGTL